MKKKIKKNKKHHNSHNIAQGTSLVLKYSDIFLGGMNRLYENFSQTNAE